VSAYGIREGILEIDGQRIDVAATWAKVLTMPTNWWYNVGIGVKDGKLKRIWRTAEEMGRPAGEPNFADIPEGLKVYAP